MIHFEFYSFHSFSCNFNLHTQAEWIEQHTVVLTAHVSNCMPLPLYSPTGMHDKVHHQKDQCRRPQKWHAMFLFQLFKVNVNLKNHTCIRLETVSNG
jgi:hypothetical protein